MLLSHRRLGRSGYIATLLLLVLAISLSNIPETQAQKTNDGEITFVRLANGEPGGEGIYIINADGSNERPFFLFEDIGLPYDVFNGGYRCPVWSTNGTQLALNGTDGETTYLAIVDVESGDVQRVYEVQHDDQILRNIYFPEWEPNTNRLSFGFIEAERNTGLVLANGIRSVSLDDSDVLTLRDDIGMTEESASTMYIGGPVPNYLPFSHSWSPDGSTLAISLYRMTLLNPNDGTERELVPMGETLNGSTVESLAYSPDGNEIAYSTMWIDVSTGVFTTAFSLSIVDVATGEISEIIRTPTFAGGDYPYNISCVDWRPTNR